MLQELPSSLCLLLETQVEEELYADWASLLETILISYCPPRTHLILCFTLLIHPSVAEDHSLHSSCLKIVVRTLKRYGPRAFRNVLGFNPARQQRRKARESNNETQTDIVGHDSLQIDLVTTESVFSKFSSLWELMSFRFSLEESKARRWQQLIGLLVEILQQDWKLACKSKLDLTKTLVVQQLRDVDENRVDLQKQVFKPLFAGLTNNGENQGTPYEGLDVHFSTDEDPSLPQCLPDQFLHMLFAVSELMLQIAQVPRLNILSQSELISVLSDNVMVLPMDFIIAITRSQGPAAGNDIQMLILSLCDSLLFRLTVPNKGRIKKSTSIDRHKIQQWCVSESNSKIPVEMVTVEWLKYAVVEQYVMLNENGLKRADLTELKDMLLHSCESVACFIRDEEGASQTVDEVKGDDSAKSVLNSLNQCQRLIHFLPAFAVASVGDNSLGEQCDNKFEPVENIV